MKRFLIVLERIADALEVLAVDKVAGMDSIRFDPKKEAHVEVRNELHQNRLSYVKAFMKKN